jgi:hypothetical protein
MLLEISENLHNSQIHLLISGLLVAVVLLLPSQAKPSKPERKQRKQ